MFSLSYDLCDTVHVCVCFFFTHTFSMRLKVCACHSLLSAMASECNQRSIDIRSRQNCLYILQRSTQKYLSTSVVSCLAGVTALA